MNRCTYRRFGEICCGQFHRSLYPASAISARTLSVEQVGWRGVAAGEMHAAVPRELARAEGKTKSALFKAQLFIALYSYVNGTGVSLDLRLVKTYGFLDYF
jgi:hypothetical protein